MIAIRDGEDRDGHDVSALLGAVFAEYDGCVFALEEMPELVRLASYYREEGGRFWVAHRTILGRPILVGCVGVVMRGDAAELKKLYVAARERRTGLGARLLELAETEAMDRGARTLELWSDTRFTTAHAFYERRGYRRTGALRPLHDASATEEFHFVRELGPTR